MCVWAAGFRASPSYARLTVTAALVSYTDRNAADGGALAEQGNAILRDKDSCPNTTGILVAIERQELVKLGDVFSSLPLPGLDLSHHDLGSVRDHADDTDGSVLHASYRVRVSLHRGVGEEKLACSLLTYPPPRPLDAISIFATATDIREIKDNGRGIQGPIVGLIPEIT